MDLPDIDRLWDYQDPVGSERRFRDVLPNARNAGDVNYTVELLSQIARAVCLQRDFDAAHAVLDEAQRLLPLDSHRPRIRCLLERGRILNDTGDAAEALKRFQQAWEIAEANEERQLGADALHMIAYVSEGDEKLRWHQVAIEFCENSVGERFRRWLCTLYMNVADEYESRKQYDRGRECVERSLAIARELQLADRILDGQCFLARFYRLSADVSRAMALVDEILAADSPRGYAFEEYAECLLLCGRADEAREQFKAAYERLVSDPWYPPTETQRLDRIKELAGLTK